MTRCCQCIVSGRVQGVFFRASTKHEAHKLNITGYAKNLPDGRVEVVACGEADAIAELQTWLRQGPPAAHVTEIQCNDIDVTAPKDFYTQ